MTQEDTRRVGEDPGTGPTRSGLPPFNGWLQVQLKARKMTQRQLAQKAGVDHSTISRLVRGDRVPSLRTATRLASGLGVAQGLFQPDDQSPGRSASPAARVEYALRSDDLLSEGEVGEIMKVYLAARLRRPRRVRSSGLCTTMSSLSMPTVTEVRGLRPR